ncbi:MAG: glycosyltransferase family 4 protein [Candidatus Omnitrophica bacterium]|nr:glycosyltransferase family 4 protein [Candidatus Omnitrophota bacterium]
MEIGFDIQCTLGKLTGIPRYTLNLLDAFSKLSEPPRLYQFSNGLRRDLKTYERFWWEAVQLPQQFAKSSANMIHVPGFGIRKQGKKKVVITAHDIIGYLFPGNMSKTAQTYWSHWLPWCYKKADHLIVDAFHTREDLVKHLRIPEKKISVIYIAADPGCVRVPVDEARREIKESLGLSDPYFLFVGTIEPRKNLIRTLKAYAQALKSKKDLPKLMIVGAKEWGTQQFEAAIKELSLENHVIATGFVPDHMLWKIYSAAHAVIFVSIYEGFGLPLVEGMTCGVPVIASNNSSLGELGKDCSYPVDPYSESEITKAILDLAQNSALGRELAEKGSRKAKEFSWQKTAEQTIEVYKNIQA